MTVDASASTAGSGTYRAVRTPPDLPAITPAGACRFVGLPCVAVRAALVEPALAIADRAHATRLRASYAQADLTAWLAARGLSPTGVPRPPPGP